MTTSAMVPFRLVYTALGGGRMVDRTFHAVGIDQAYLFAGEIIAQTHGVDGAHVEFDRCARSVTIGAGYRCWRGSFNLGPATSGEPS